MNDKSSTIIFTDGASRGNPGPGGWAAIIVEKKGEERVIEIGGGDKHTTNNQMELVAAIKSLTKTTKDSKIIVYSDSSYLIHGITRWIHGWKRSKWKTKNKKDVLNRGLWEKLAKLDAERAVEWEYVGGHVGVAGNERCDEVATSFADGKKIKLYKGSLSDYDIPNVLDISHDGFKSFEKSTRSSHSRAQAHSYVSMVGGVIQTHQTWQECEKRVKGTRGARYKKALSAADEAKIIAEFKAI